LFSCSSNRMRMRASRSSVASAWVTPGLIPFSKSAIVSHRCRHDVETPKSVAIQLIGAPPRRATATTSLRFQRVRSAAPHACRRRGSGADRP
jgi:hypothetical protein